MEGGNRDSIGELGQIIPLPILQRPLALPLSPIVALPLEVLLCLPLPLGLSILPLSYPLSLSVTPYHPRSFSVSFSFKYRLNSGCVQKEVCGDTMILCNEKE